MALLIQSKEIVGRFDVSGNFAVLPKKIRPVSQIIFPLQRNRISVERWGKIRRIYDEGIELTTHLIFNFFLLFI